MKKKKIYINLHFGLTKTRKKMKCHAISLPIQSCLWKCAKMMKDSMNKMIKKNKRLIPICLFFGESERKKQKKMIQKFVWKIKKKMFVFMMMIFFRKDEIICTEKKT